MPIASPAVFLQEVWKPRRPRTWPLQGGGPGQFISNLCEDDEVAIKATGNVTYFCRAVKSVAYFGIVSKVSQSNNANITGYGSKWRRQRLCNAR